MRGERSNTITVVFGRKGSGKTSWTRGRLVEYSRRIIIDPMWEYRDGVVVQSVADFADYVRPLRHHRYSVIFQTREPDDCAAICEILTAGRPTAPALPNVLLVVDELDRFCGPHHLPEGLAHVINYGRHYGVSFVGVSRRPKRVHRDVTANVDEVICFQTQEPGDLKYLAEFIGEDRAAKLPGLAAHHWLSSEDVAEIAPVGGSADPEPVHSDGMGPGQEPSPVSVGPESGGAEPASSVPGG